MIKSVCFCSLVSCLCFILSYEAYSQNEIIKNFREPDFVKLTGNVKIIDSQYFVIVKLSVTNNDTIQLDKIDYFYEDGHNAVSNRKLFLEKKIRNLFAHLYVVACRLPIWGSDWEKKVSYSKENGITDTVRLDNLYPFEISDYRITVSFDYYYKSEKFTVTSDYIYFAVPFLPRNSIFNE